MNAFSPLLTVPTFYFGHLGTPCDCICLLRACPSKHLSAFLFERLAPNPVILAGTSFVYFTPNLSFSNCSVFPLVRGEGRLYSTMCPPLQSWGGSSIPVFLSLSGVCLPVLQASHFTPTYPIPVSADAFFFIFRCLRGQRSLNQPSFDNCTTQPPTVHLLIDKLSGCFHPEIPPQEDSSSPRTTVHFFGSSVFPPLPVPSH